MKIFKIYSFILLSILLFKAHNCYTQSIIANKTISCIPAEIKFSCSQSGITDIVWNFNDMGSYSTNASSSHIFNKEGSYNITLSAKLDGVTFKDSISITLYKGFDKLALSLTSLNMGCVPLSASFADSSIGSGNAEVIKRVWDFGDGVLDSSGHTAVSHDYVKPGIYDVRLRLTDIKGCEAEIEKTDFIKTSTPPAINITTNPATLLFCKPPVHVTFDASKTISSIPFPSNKNYFNWDFNNSQTSTNSTPPIQTYDSYGTYAISLTVTDEYNCVAYKEFPLLIENPLASFDLPDTVCKDEEFKIVNYTRNMKSNLWLYSDGGKLDTLFINPATDFIDTLKHKYHVKNIDYVVKLSIEDMKGCKNDSTRIVHVDNITAQYTPSGFGCDTVNQIKFTNQSLNAISYKWYFGDPYDNTIIPVTDENPSSSFSYKLGNEYTWNSPNHEAVSVPVKLVVTSPHGCKDSIMDAVKAFYLPTAIYTQDKSNGCVPLTINFTDHSDSYDEIISRTWNFGDGTIITGNELKPTHIYQDTGVYWVQLTITNKSGCTDSSFKIPIKVGGKFDANLSFDFMGKQILCQGDILTITDSTANANLLDGWKLTINNTTINSCDKLPLKNIKFIVSGQLSISYIVRQHECFTEKIYSPSTFNVSTVMCGYTYSSNCSDPSTYTFKVGVSNAKRFIMDYNDGTYDTIIYNDITSSSFELTHTYKKSNDYFPVAMAFDDGPCGGFTYSKQVKVRNPVANFTCDTLVCVGLPFHLDASTSKDIDVSTYSGYEWNWGDGFYPIRTPNKTIDHTYIKAGAIKTYLVVKDIHGCTDTTWKTIYINDVKAKFETDKIFGCLPLTINCTNKSTADTTLASYEWFFNDTIFSTEINPSHTSLKPLLDSNLNIVADTIVLIAKDILGCIGYDTVAVSPSVPISGFDTISNTIICEEDVLCFKPTVNNNNKYSWNFGDNNTDFRLKNDLYYHIYDTAGVFDVTLTVTDSIGCINSTSRPHLVTVFVKPDAEYTLNQGGEQAYCKPFQGIFTDITNDTTIIDRLWDLNDGSPKQNLKEVGTIYLERGTYNTSLVITTKHQCKDTAYKTFTVISPAGDFTLSKTTICRGDSITVNLKDTSDTRYFAWDFGDGNIIKNTNPLTHPYYFIPESNLTKLTLVLISSDSACSSTVDKAIAIYYVKAAFKLNDSSAYCTNKTIAIIDKSTNATSWSWNLGKLNSSAQSPVFELADSGIFTLKMHVLNSTTNCTDSTDTILHIYASPVVTSIGGDTCEGKPTQIETNSTVGKFKWSPSVSLNNDTIKNPIAIPMQSTTYIVTVTSADGCTNTSKAIVNIQKHPDIVDLHESIIIGESITLDAFTGDDFSYQWIADTALHCNTCIIPQVTVAPQTNHNYFIVVKDSMGCYNDTSKFYIEVLVKSSIDVPDVFTPNQDGINDIAYIKGWGIKKLLSFKIYNRWGQLIFETNDINQGWDGTFNNKPQTSDTYVYLIDYENYFTTETQSLKGYLTLIR